jgi:hypothetical protein
MGIESAVDTSMNRIKHDFFINIFSKQNCYLIFSRISGAFEKHHKYHDIWYDDSY